MCSCWSMCCCVGGRVGSLPRAGTISSTTTPNTLSGKDPPGKRGREGGREGGLDFKMDSEDGTAW